MLAKCPEFTDPYEQDMCEETAYDPAEIWRQEGMDERSGMPSTMRNATEKSTTTTPAMDRRGRHLENANEPLASHHT